MADSENGVMRKPVLVFRDISMRSAHACLILLQHFSPFPLFCATTTLVVPRLVVWIYFWPLRASVIFVRLPLHSFKKIYHSKVLLRTLNSMSHQPNAFVFLSINAISCVESASLPSYSTPFLTVWTVCTFMPRSVLCTPVTTNLL